VDTRETLVAAALKILEREGAAHFSTRAVCLLANVTAPTLYHHFGSSDGLLSAAVAEAFRQFLESKRVAKQSSDPAIALRQGWDNYVRFAAERPRLYAVMIGRVLLGASIPAAEQARALHVEHIRAIAARGQLAIPADAAACDVSREAVRECRRAGGVIMDDRGSPIHNADERPGARQPALLKAASRAGATKLPHHCDPPTRHLGSRRFVQPRAY
jgi:AcrR family transcriptional regulator